MSDLDRCIAVQRESLATMKKLFDRFVAKAADSKTRGYVNSLALEIDYMHASFKENHEEISGIVRDTSLPVDTVPYLNDDIFYEYTELFLTFKGMLVDTFPENNNTAPLSSTFANPNNQTTPNNTAAFDSELPKIPLPKFSGDYMEWFPFRDIFLSMVHENDSISKIKKFHYLKGTLTGEAASLIKTISVVAANYDSAWSILESRYHNKRVIVGSLISKLFSISKSDGKYQSIKTLLDTSQECLSSLANLEIDTESWDPILIHIIAQKLDIETRKDWEQSLRSSTEVPKRAELFAFLERTFRTLESLHEDNFSNKQKFTKPFQTKQRKSSCHSANIQSQKPAQRAQLQKTNNSKPPLQKVNCPFCQWNHSLAKCYRFLALSLKSKIDFLQQNRICTNCLSSQHDLNLCSSPFRCNIANCNRNHHTVLHGEDSANHSQSNHTSASTSANLQVSMNNANAFSNVLLYTIRLFIQTQNGDIPLRALLDPGSQGSIISESAVQLLGLKKTKSYCKVVGIGDHCGNVSKSTVNLNILSRKLEPVLSCSALVLPSVSSYSPQIRSTSMSLPNMQLDSFADPFYYRNDPIDLILGSDICFKVKIPTESFIHQNLFFQNTLFGWVFSGSPDSVSLHTINIHNINLENILKSFWEQEEVSEKREMTEEELACENYFKQTTKRSESGRYIVNLPFKSILKGSAVPAIHNNHVGALKRLRQMEIAFSKRPVFAEAYKTFMSEYEALNHMSKIGTFPADLQQNSYFLPHHGVLKEDSTTTKLRVVFDGSSHLQGYQSLNDELAPGPALQNDLPQIMTKWRLHRIAFSADIEKMFRQIEICPEHRRFQQILWRSNPADEISIFQLNTVSYGTTSAPYLSIRVLHKMAEDCRETFPNESKILVTDSYVDDVISGADTVEKAVLIQKNLCKLLEQGGCNLRKWISNSPELLKEIPEEYREKSITLGFDRDNVVKTLGIQWNTKSDTFFFKVNLEKTDKLSKRTILSESARLYDPLGWLTPSTVIAKSIFKELWERGVDWDSAVPEDLADRWNKYKSSLSTFSHLKIPRWIHFSKNCTIELHCFCDASTKAFAAVVYARINSSNQISVNILQAKSKVSPIKMVSIPRLELCAAALLVKLTRKVKESFADYEIGHIQFWSDSSTVLSWIRKSSSNWSVYVGNRVAEIQRHSSPSQWRYVPSALNPADCASRGIFPDELTNSKTWWYGPEFLYQTSNFWPENLPVFETSEEVKKTKITAHITTELSYPEVFTKFSNLQKLLRLSSVWFRFRSNCKSKIEFRDFGPLKTSEINQTFEHFIKIGQQVDFAEEIKQIQTKSLKNNSLLKLMPFLDDKNILRVGGRLQNADLPYAVKHPILLSKRNPISKLIILDAHEKTLHGGITLTMSYVNRKFWIISGNQLAKNVIHGCIICYRQTAKTSSQIMGNLPSVRLNVTRPFKHSGVDYAGPISIKNSTLRSAVVSKGYISLFICMATKAIHLELVSDLTTNAFLAAFRRFTSRRGACTDIYSDCGTNFVGASKELKVLFQKSQASLPEELRHSLSTLGTTWHFIPPASPNFGGLWEAGVKSVKFHLRRILNDRILTFEELSTCLCQIESCLNSRPLCPISTDPSDFVALTPAHFLIGEPTNCIQEETLLNNKIERLTHWKMIEKLKQHFWKRWHMEYLNRLQSRPKWLRPTRDANPGDLVLVADDRVGPAQWILGRIKEIHPGRDGHTRVVSVLTKNKVLKRPISKISFLPLAPQDDQDDKDDQSFRKIL